MSRPAERGKTILPQRSGADASFLSVLRRSFAGERAHDSWRRSTRQAACPPKAKEFESATSTAARARRVRHVVEVARRIGRLVIDGRMHDLIAQRQRRDDRLDGPGRHGRVADHRFGRADRESRPRVRETRFLMASVSARRWRRRRAVRVDVVDVATASSSRVRQRAADGQHGAGALGMRIGGAIRITRRAEPAGLGVDARAAPPRVLALFEDRACQRPRPSRSRHARRRTAGWPRAADRFASTSAPSRQNDARPIGYSSESAPPAMTTSARPRRIQRIASPIACVPPAHAVMTPSSDRRGRSSARGGRNRSRRPSRPPRRAAARATAPPTGHANRSVAAAAAAAAHAAKISRCS